MYLVFFALVPKGLLGHNYRHINKVQKSVVTDEDMQLVIERCIQLNAGERSGRGGKEGRGWMETQHGDDIDQ